MLHEEGNGRKEKKMTENIEVLTHSSIRITGDVIIYIDPYRIEKESKDGDIILITHDHFDHFSPEDIERVRKEDTLMIVPEKMKKQAQQLSFHEIITVQPGDRIEQKGIEIETIPAYNNGKPFHPKRNGWVGYILNVNGVRIYIAGDTDMTKENQSVSCDAALVPIGGTYTMNAEKAAELINIIKPHVAIPIHYGSVVGNRQDEEEFRARVENTIAVEIKMQRYA